MKKNEGEVLELLNHSKYNVLSTKDLYKIHLISKKIYGFKSLSFNDFLTYCLSRDIISKKAVKGEFIKGFNIYGINSKKPNIFDYASSLSRSSHFSHYTALFLNGLTLQIPKSIYMTNERKSPNNVINCLSQDKIDLAFSKKARVRKDFKELQGSKIYTLNGMFQEKIGVVDLVRYKVTDIERTLIDITVRPHYSGGVTQVLEAYKNSKGIVDIDKLYHYYVASKYIYPYHQSIGFYLEKSGFTEKDIAPFLNLERPYNFYLTYNIAMKEYSTRWNLFYPKGL